MSPLTTPVTVPTPVDAAHFADIEVHRAGAEDIDVVMRLSDQLMAFHSRPPMFWPFLRTADVAARNITSNGLDGRIELHRVGIGGVESTRQAAFDPRMPHEATTAEDQDSATTVQVHLTTLTSALSRARSLAGRDHRIVLKIDCEGCEGEIFSGDAPWPDAIASAIVETHSDGLKRQVLDRLETAGYHCVVVSDVPSLSTAVVMATRPLSEGRHVEDDA